MHLVLRVKPPWDLSPPHQVTNWCQVVWWCSWCCKSQPVHSLLYFSLTLSSCPKCADWDKAKEVHLLSLFKFSRTGTEPHKITDSSFLIVPSWLLPDGCTIHPEKPWKKCFHFLYNGFLFAVELMAYVF